MLAFIKFGFSSNQLIRNKRYIYRCTRISLAYPSKREILLFILLLVGSLKILSFLLFLIKYQSINRNRFFSLNEHISAWVNDVSSAKNEWRKNALDKTIANCFERSHFNVLYSYKNASWAVTSHFFLLFFLCCACCTADYRRGMCLIQIYFYWKISLLLFLFLFHSATIGYNRVSIVQSSPWFIVYSRKNVQ